MKKKKDVRAGRFRFGVSDAPAAGVPIAQLHPPDVRAARLTIFRQMLFRPAAAPIFKMNGLRRRRTRGEMDDHAMDLAWIFPQQTVSVGQGEGEWCGVERRVERVSVGSVAGNESQEANDWFECDFH